MLETRINIIQMRFLKKVLLFIFLIIGYASSTIAQVAITALPFLEINNNARSMGMGGATVALNYSSGGLHLNPATFGKNNMLEVYSPFNAESENGFFTTPWLPAFNVEDLYLQNPRVIIGFEKFSIGYQFTYINLGEQEFFDETNTLINTSNYYEYVHTLSFSMPVGKYFSFGFGLNDFKSSPARGVVINGNEVKAATGLTYDFGAHFEYPLNFELVRVTPLLGWSLTDFGYPIRYSPSTQEDPLPMIMRGGFGLQVTSNAKLLGLELLSLGIYGSLEKLMARKEEKTKTQNGQTIITYEPLGPGEALFRSWGPIERFNGQGTRTLNVWEQFRRQSGLEYTLLEIFSIRLGKYYEHPDNGNRVYDTIGFGINLKYFTFDYARLDLEDNDSPLNGTELYELSINLPLDILFRK